MELAAAHIRIAVYDDAVPRHFHIVEEHQRVVLVVAGRERVVKIRDGMLLVRFARKYLEFLGCHRHGETDRIVDFVGSERLQMRDEHFVCHDRAGAEHLGTADRHAGCILVDDLQHRVVVAELAC